MASRRINRFVSEEAPDQESADDFDQKSVVKQHTQKEAVLLFKKERKDSGLLARACNKAECILSSGKVGSESDSALDHYSKVAIVVFTLESPNIYMDFNSRSRMLSISSWESFPYKGMWLLLNKAIMSYERNYMQTTDRLRVKTVYRGISTLVDLAPGCEFCFRQITSTSLSADVAYSFSNKGGTLFIIKLLIGLPIKDFSLYPVEEELIVSGFNRYIVTRVVDKHSCRKIYLTFDPDSNCESHSGTDSESDSGTDSESDREIDGECDSESASESDRVWQ